MKTKLAFITLILSLVLSYTALAKDSMSSIELKAIVLPNIAIFFDGKNLVIETNDNENVVITKTDTTTTIVPAL